MARPRGDLGDARGQVVALGQAVADEQHSLALASPGDAFGETAFAGAQPRPRAAAVTRLATRRSEEAGASGQYVPSRPPDGSPKASPVVYAAAS